LLSLAKAAAGANLMAATHIFFVGTGKKLCWFLGKWANFKVLPFL
jgi:hypothetical protein